MSSGSAPTVLARMSSVSTSHSFSRFGYCLAESSLRGTSPDPDLAAVPSTVLGQPAELRAVFTRPVTRVCSASVWSEMPPHSGNIGPWVEACVGAGDCGAPGEFDPELSEHAANTGITAAQATASALAHRDLPVAHLRGVTPCTVAAAQYLNHHMPIDLPIYRILRWPCRTQLRRG